MSSLCVESFPWSSKWFLLVFNSLEDGWRDLTKRTEPARGQVVKFDRLFVTTATFAHWNQHQRRNNDLAPGQFPWVPRANPLIYSHLVFSYLLDFLYSFVKGAKNKLTKGAENPVTLLTNSIPGPAWTSRHFNYTKHIVPTYCPTVTTRSTMVSSIPRTVSPVLT